MAIRMLPAWFIGDNQCNVTRNVSVSKFKPFQSYIPVLFNYPVSSQLSLGIVQPPSLMLLPGFYFSPDHKALLVVMYTFPYMNWVYVSRCIFLCGHGFFSCNITKAFCWSGLMVTVLLALLSQYLVLIFFSPVL